MIWDSNIIYDTFLKSVLEITALLALGALTHGITKLGGRILLLQLTVHLHNLLVPIRGTLGHLAGLTLATFDGIIWGGSIGNSWGSWGIGDRWGSGNIGGVGATSLTTCATLTTLIFCHLYLYSIFLHT